MADWQLLAKMLRYLVSRLGALELLDCRPGALEPACMADWQLLARMLTYLVSRLVALELLDCRPGVLEPACIWLAGS